MVKIPLIGVPKHAWEMLKETVSVSPILLVWRIALISTLIILSYLAIALTGGSGLVAIILGFAITSILSYTLRDDILAIWTDLWNARWGEVRI